MDAAATALCTLYSKLHWKVIGSLTDLSDEEIARHRPYGNSIGFNVWHIARWDDSLAAVLAGHSADEHGFPTGQVWQLGAWATRWKLPIRLGVFAAGTGLSDEEASGLRLPGRDELTDYATAVVEAFDLALTGLSADSWAAPYPGRKASTAQQILYYYEHAARHLGMIEALRGLGGRPGSIVD